MAVHPQLIALKAMRAKKDSVWSDWIQPVLHPKRYTLFCCDCALCHQFQFRIVTNPKTGEQRIRWRVKRANLYTQMKRKHKVESDRITLLNKGERIEALHDGVMVITLENGLRRGGGKKMPPKKKAKRHA